MPAFTFLKCIHHFLVFILAGASHGSTASDVLQQVKEAKQAPSVTLWDVMMWLLHSWYCWWKKIRPTSFLIQKVYIYIYKYIYLFIFTGGWLIRRKFIPIHRRVSYTSQVVVWRSSSNSKFCKSLIGAKKLGLSVYLAIYNLLSFRRVVRELWTSRLDTDMMQKKKSPCNWHESFSTR